MIGFLHDVVTIPLHRELGSLGRRAFAIANGNHERKSPSSPQSTPEKALLKTPRYYPSSSWSLVSSTASSSPTATCPMFSITPCTTSLPAHIGSVVSSPPQSPASPLDAPLTNSASLTSLRASTRRVAPTRRTSSKPLPATSPIPLPPPSAVTARTASRTSICARWTSQLAGSGSTLARSAQ